MVLWPTYCCTTNLRGPLCSPPLEVSLACASLCGMWSFGSSQSFIWRMWPLYHKICLKTFVTRWAKTQHFPQILNFSWGDFIRTGRFPAKFRLLHQHVTRDLHCIILNYEARLCCCNDNISSNSQAGQWNMEHIAMDSWYMFFKKHDSTSFQSVYCCLSVYRHNVSPCFHNRCLSQLSFELLFYNNMCWFYVTL